MPNEKETETEVENQQIREPQKAGIDPENPEVEDLEDDEDDEEAEDEVDGDAEEDIVQA